MAESTGETGCVLLATEIMGMNEMSAGQVCFSNVLYCLNPLWTQFQYQHLLVVVSVGCVCMVGVCVCACVRAWCVQSHV